MGWGSSNNYKTQNTKVWALKLFCLKENWMYYWNVSNKLKDYAETQQNKTTIDIILILEDTLCHITYVTS